jgi:gluconokinase
MLIIVMGVTGAGKTTVGMRLATTCGAKFHDADDYHSAAAIEKMKSGEALTEADRGAWLGKLESLIAKMGGEGANVLACSALRVAYRSRLSAAAARAGIEPVFVYLGVSPEVAAGRLRDRQEHFMPVSLVESQFATLEEPNDATVVDARAAPEVLVKQVLAALNVQPKGMEGN